MGLRQSNEIRIIRLTDDSSIDENTAYVVLLTNKYQLQMIENKTEFYKWMLSDNVVKRNENGVSFWASQDAMYRNRMHTMKDAWKYYKKEFINV